MGTPRAGLVPEPLLPANCGTIDRNERQLEFYECENETMTRCAMTHSTLIKS